MSSMPSVPHHQRARLCVPRSAEGLGYVLDGVPYGYPDSQWISAANLALRHASALDFLELDQDETAQAQGQQAAARLEQPEGRVLF